MKIRLLRHATVMVEFDGKRILVDPVLSAAGNIPAIPGVRNQSANPLVELPRDAQEVTSVDAVLVTHTHIDHFDDAAQQILPPDMQLFCQPTDQPLINQAGFKRIQPVDKSYQWQGIEITRTGGQHGTGRMAEKMGLVSGFILSAIGEPTLYITGDTIWCPEVEAAIKEYCPQVIICFGGAAQFVSGGPITMNEFDIAEVCTAAPQAKVVVVHMEAWNHCVLSRQELHDFISSKGLTAQVVVPTDGQWMDF